MTSASPAGQREILTYAAVTQAELLSSGTARGIRYGLATGNGQPWIHSYIPGSQPNGDGPPDIAVHILRDQQGTPLGMLYDRQSFSYLAEHLGTVTGICASDGRQQASYAYEPYGRLTMATGPLAALNLVRYTGAFADPAEAGGTGFTHMGYRWQDPAAGRFTQQDTISRIGDPANGNLYAYAADNPVNYIDPTGQSWWDPASWNWGDILGCAGAILGTAGAVAGFLAISFATAGTFDVFAAGVLIAGAGTVAENIAFFGAGASVLGGLFADFAAC